MELSIIIVNWNSVGHLRKCLASLRAFPPAVQHEVVVVDNASFDGCGEMLATEFPEVVFVQSEKNLGFAGANNLGFQHSCGSRLLLLNPDTEVTAGALDALLETVDKKEDAGVVGARLLNSDGTLQTSCVQRFPSLLNQLLDADLLRDAFPRAAIWGMAPLLDRAHEPVAVETISGACMMLRRSVFEAVGKFTEAYFMYTEDVDLCFKAWKAGRANYYLDRAVVYHHGGVSTKSHPQSHFSAVKMRESRLKFFTLYRGPGYAWAYRATTAAVALARYGVLGGLWMVRRHAETRHAMGKWGAILRWSLSGGTG